MKKRAVALLCLLAALITLLIPWSAAAGPYEGVYLVGVNDSVLLRLITTDQMPVLRSGSIYVPYTVLDSKELGLSYALNRTGGTFTIFNRKQTLIFQLNGSGSTDKQGNEYQGRIITRNGVVFIPMRFVASFFGLTYSFYNVVLPDGTVPIARVCTSQASMSDGQFSASAAQLVAGPIAQYLASQATPSPSADPPRPSGSPAPTPSAQPDPSNICFAVACTDGGGFSQLLDAFSSARLSALFLFAPDDLLTRDGDVRAAAAAGHQIGLLLGPDDPEGDFLLGNQRLGHILRCEATQVAFPNGGRKEGNWWIWSGNVTARGRSITAQAENLAQDVSARRVARVTLNDSRVTALALRRNLSTWSQRPYTLFTPTETD